MSLPAAPEGLDLTESKVSNIFGALVSTWSIALIVVILRVVSRRLQRNPLWLEDYLVFFGFCCATVHVFSNVGYMVPHGVGKHVWVAPVKDYFKAWAIGLFISEIVYTLTILFVKWSTLCFYWRIFSARPSIRIPIWVLAGVVTGWAIGVIMASIFQCVPTQAFWMRFDLTNPATDFYCGVQTKPFFIGNAIPNIITDAMIVALPIPYVLALHLPLSQRIALAAIFTIGAFVTIISCVRLVFVLNIDLASPDITWNFSEAVIWTNLEGNIAIICSCLPSLKPILKLALTGTLRSSKGTGDPKSTPSNVGDRYLRPGSKAQLHFMNSKNHTATVKADRIDGSHPFVTLDDRDSNSFNNNTMMDDSGSGVELNTMGGIAPVSNNGITVTKKYHVQSNKWEESRGV